MYKVLLTTDDPTALMRSLTRFRGRHVADQVLMKELETEAVAEAHIRDYVRHPFKTIFKAIARLALTTVLLAALCFLIGVFAFGLVGVLTNFGLAGLVGVGLSLGILMAYVIVLDRSEPAT